MAHSYSLWIAPFELQVSPIMKITEGTDKKNSNIKYIDEVTFDIHFFVGYLKKKCFLNSNFWK